MGKQAKGTESVSLVDVLRHATSTDLDEIRETVAELESELATYVADKTREIGALKAAAKLLSVRLNGKPPRQPRGAKAGKATGGGGREDDDDPTSLRCQIYDAIAEDGPQTIVELCDRLHRTTQAVAMSVSRCPWLVRRGDEVSHA